MLGTDLLPVWYLLLTVFFLGAIVGSFCNVVAYRFHTGRSINGRSHCLSCGQQLRWFELVPLASYLIQRGRCRRCRARVPVRYFAVEIATGSLFLSAWIAASTGLELALFWLLSMLAIVTVIYDFYHFVIPDEFTGGFFALAILQFGLYAYAGILSLETLGYSVLAASAASGFFFALWYFSQGRWLGFGDVKLAFPLALMVGAHGAFSFVVLSFWIGAATSILIMAGLWLRQRGQPHLQFSDRPLTMQSAVPFAPFLVASFLAVRFFGIDVIALLTYAPS